MRRFLLLLVFAVGLACHGPAASGAAEPSSAPSKPQRSSDAVKKELSAVIDAQLAAFRANDYPKAYTFAAAGVKTLFPLDGFEKMVRTNYPVIAGSVSTEYGLAFDTGEEAVINVRIENAAKKSVEFQYLLTKEDGVWKIGGVSELKAEGLSV